MKTGEGITQLQVEIIALIARNHEMTGAQVVDAFPDVSAARVYRALRTLRDQELLAAEMSGAGHEWLLRLGPHGKEWLRTQQKNLIALTKQVVDTIRIIGERETA